MKVIMVGGYPASGKSTIFKRLFLKMEREGFSLFRQKKDGIVSYMESKDIVVLGSYDPSETFPGTDRLPMSVQPKAEEFIEKLLQNEQAQHGKEKILLLEGDRLFNDKMIRFIKGLPEVDFVLCVVTMEPSLLQSRREARSEQNETWRKGRATKVDRIAMSHSVTHHMENNTEEDVDKCAEELLAEIKGEWKREQPKSKIKDLWS